MFPHPNALPQAPSLDLLDFQKDIYFLFTQNCSRGKNKSNSVQDLMTFHASNHSSLCFRDASGYFPSSPPTPPTSPHFPLIFSLNIGIPQGLSQVPLLLAYSGSRTAEKARRVKADPQVTGLSNWTKIDHSSLASVCKEQKSTQTSSSQKGTL